MFFKQILTIFKYLLISKWKFKLPKKNKYLVFDGINNPFTKYIKKKNITILYRRGEEINFNILLRCLVKFKFTTLDYAVEFIKQVSPKLILTAFDYHTIFYKLSKSTGVKTLMLQKAKRSKKETFIKNKNFIYFPKNSKKKFFVDYILVYNKTVKKFYSNKINGKIFTIGSFLNNISKPISQNKLKNEIVFISNFSDKNINKSENEDIIALELYKLAKINNLKFNILPRYKNNNQLLEKEIYFYKKKYIKNVTFILNKNKSSYDLLKKYKYIFTTYSTLGAELLCKGYRVGYIMSKKKNNPIWYYSFGNFENLESKGRFWSNLNIININEIQRVFKFVVFSNYKCWKNKTFYYSKQVMDYDYDNKTFKKIIKKF